MSLLSEKVATVLECNYMRGNKVQAENFSTQVLDTPNLDVEGMAVVTNLLVSDSMTVEQRLHYNDAYYGLAKDAYPKLEPAFTKLAFKQWTLRYNGSLRFTSVAWSPQFGFVGVGNTIVFGGPKNPNVSPNGLDWSIISFNPPVGLIDVVWCNELNMYVAVANSGTNRAYYSINGNNNWLTGNTGVTLTGCNNVGLGNTISCASTANLFVGQDVGSTVITAVLSNTSFSTAARINGLSDSTLKADSQWQTLIWVKALGLFVALGNEGAVMTSSNGIDWTTRFGGLPNFLVSLSRKLLCWSPELQLLFCTDANSGRVLHSSNGTDWSVVNNANLVNQNFTQISWSSPLGLFVLTPSGGNYVFTSVDGYTWVSRTLPVTINKSGVVWIDQLSTFLIFTDVDTRALFLVSPDGINWVTEPGIYVGNVAAFAFSPELGLGVFGSYYNNTYALYTCYLGGRTPTAANVFHNSPLNNMNEQGLWTVPSFARASPKSVGSPYTVLPGDTWLVCNGLTIVKLPLASEWPGRELMLEQKSAFSVVSDTSNVINRVGNSTTIVVGPTAGGWATLVSDGSNWLALAGNTAPL
jgi:hypothetical protein